VSNDEVMVSSNRYILLVDEDILFNVEDADFID
jgi:hypothetical protein